MAIKKIKKCGLKLEPGCSYFVDENGNVVKETPSTSSGGIFETKREIVLKSAVRPKPGNRYLIDEDGDIVRATQEGKKGNGMPFEKKYYSVGELADLIDIGFILPGDERFRALIISVIIKIPANVVNKLLKECVVLSTWPSAKATSIPNEQVRKSDIILISDIILSRGKKKNIENIILHEFAHCWLNHKCGVFVGKDIEVANRQEKEADQLAKKWLKEYEEYNEKYQEKKGYDEWMSSLPQFEGITVSSPLPPRDDKHLKARKVPKRKKKGT